MFISWVCGRILAPAFLFNLVIILVRFFFISLILIYFFSCRPNENNTIVQIQAKGFICDSIGYRVVKLIGGHQLIDTLLPIGSPLILQNIQEDMYIVALYWPRTFVSHQMFGRRGFNPEAIDHYILTKALYINPNETTKYNLSTTSPLSLGAIESAKITELNLDVHECPSCLLAERYWSNYSDFFRRKDSLSAVLTQRYYHAVDQNDKAVRQKYLAAHAAKNNLQTDSLFMCRLDSLVSLNPEDAVSTFFVFYLLYNDREFVKYQRVFKKLKGSARRSKYYASMKSRF